ncbi:MAG TPA: flavodoxin domain-containing protein [Candidatus Limnocylindria bacterium]|nr:flavodoxin domain-containing protein [Candidatus Limnocylindria bacterium]
MKSVVIYASHAGNTRRIAEAVARALRTAGPTEVMHAEQVMALEDDVDLLVIGGPTEGHGPTPEIKDLVHRIAGTVRGLRAAAFDTRLQWPKLLSGSAAAAIGASLRASGARVVLPPESFIVSMKPELLPGEEERATAWGEQLVNRVAELAIPV